MAARLGKLGKLMCTLGAALACSRGGAERTDVPTVTPTSSTSMTAPALTSAAPALTSAAPALTSAAPALASAAPALTSAAPAEPPPDAFELRRREVRRIVAEPGKAPGFDALRLGDTRFLGEVVLDRDPALARAAVMALSTLGEPGLAAMEGARAKLSADAPAETRQALDEHIASSNRARPRANPPLDPFEQPPRGTRPNCGPDERMRFAVTLKSTADFAEFLRTRGRWIDDATQLDDFRDAAGAVDWTLVAAKTQVSKLGNRTVYALRYVPGGCAGYDLRMTNDGFTSLYGCCGK
jgi:hypothetical protein